MQEIIKHALYHVDIGLSNAAQISVKERSLSGALFGKAVVESSVFGYFLSQFLVEKHSFPPILRLCCILTQFYKICFHFL